MVSSYAGPTGIGTWKYFHWGAEDFVPEMSSPYPNDYISGAPPSVGAQVKENNSRIITLRLPETTLPRQVASK